MVKTPSKASLSQMFLLVRKGIDLHVPNENLETTTQLLQLSSKNYDNFDIELCHCNMSSSGTDSASFESAATVVYDSHGN